MKILITGASGQVGHALQETAPANFRLLTPARKELNFSAPTALPERLKSFAPDIVINAAAYTDVEKAEAEAELAQRVNATAAGAVAEYCATAGIPLVHISSDYVFDGLSKVPYVPDSKKEPLGVYARSKAEGEELVQKCYKDGYIVRSGWLYGLHGHNFVKTMLRLAAEKPEISVVNDQMGTPTYSANLAGMIWRLLEVKPATRIWHYSDAGATSWYEFAKAVFVEARSAGLIDKEPRVKPIRTAELNCAAPRPAFSVLDKQQTWTELGVVPMHWRKSLATMLAELASRESSVAEPAKATE